MLEKRPWDRLTGLLKEDGLKFPGRLGPSLRVSSSALRKQHALVPILSAERTPSHSAQESPETGDYLELEMGGHVVLIAAGPDGNFWVRPGKQGWPGALPKVAGNVRLFDSATRGGRYAFLDEVAPLGACLWGDVSTLCQSRRDHGGTLS